MGEKARLPTIHEDGVLTTHFQNRTKERPKGVSPWTVLLAIVSIVGSFILIHWPTAGRIESERRGLLMRFEACSIRNIYLDTNNLAFLSTAHPLPVSEFVTRRDNLAKALSEDGVDAFVVEPGYTFSYYANVTQTDWEVWEPEERPFLMIVRPVLVDASNGDGKEKEVRARTTFLAPSFEVERVRLLGMPFNEGRNVEVVSYEEHWNPYEVLRKAWSKDEKSLLEPSVAEDGVQEAFGEHVSSMERNAKKNSKNPIIMVDEEMRDFIQRGLSENEFKVIGLGGAIERVRQTKSEREVGILRAVNTGTVEAVRAMRKCMFEGLTEAEVTTVLDNTLRAVGLEPFFDIVLFDENASNPHGGTNGSKVLEATTFVLIDVGAHLYGYSSDICRTFFPPFYPKPTTPSAFSALPPAIKKKLSIWDLVLDAQTASLHALIPNNTAASVDIAARNVISAAGYGKAFTHRVGHGIGIKAHESPYLNKGNTRDILKKGMTFTSEPGVYLVNEFGVRHEDILLVGGSEDGKNVDILTGQRATGPWDP